MMVLKVAFALFVGIGIGVLMMKYAVAHRPHNIVKN